MRIANKIFLLAVPLAIIPLFLVGLFTYVTLTRGFEEQMTLEDRHLCLIGTTKIEQILDECRNGLLFLAPLIEQHIEKSEYNFETLAESFQNPVQEFADGLAVRYSPYIAIRIVNATGRELYVTKGMNRSLNLGITFERPYFLQAVSLAANRRVPMQFPTGNYEGRQAITAFSMPFYHDIELIGFVFLELDVEIFSRVFDELGLSTQAYYFLMDGRGSVMAKGGFFSNLSDAELFTKLEQDVTQILPNSNTGFVRNELQESHRNYHLSSSPIKEYIYYLEPIPEERWYLGMVRGESPLFSLFRQTQIVFLAILILGLTFAIAGTIFMSRRITTPIAELTNRTNAFARGDLDSKIDIRSTDEMGQLAAGFNKMARDLKRLIHERQINETLVTVGRFSSALAHDLRNPVEGIKLLSGELGKKMDPKRPEYEIATALRQSVDHLSSLINQSLDFARLATPKFVKTDVKDLVDTVLNEFQFGRIELKKECVSDLAPVEIDAVQIQRVLSNLIRNAIDACRSRRNDTPCRIEVKLEKSGSNLRLEVSDTGQGIPAENQERIFEPFFTTKPEGHGLGLAMVRQIVRNHGGEIILESEIGKGTRFIIQLPIVRS